MTISEAIAVLDKQRGQYGEIEIYFDCPHCGKSFSPNRVAIIGVHLKSDGKQK